VPPVLYCPPSQLHFASHHGNFVLVADNIDERGLSIQVSPFCASSQRRSAHLRCAPCLQIATELNWTSSCQRSLAASVAECHSASSRWRPPSRTRACDLRRLACDVFATADSIAVAAPPHSVLSTYLPHCTPCQCQRSRHGSLPCSLSSPLPHQRSRHGSLPRFFTPLAAECLPCLFSTTGPSSLLLRSSHRPRFRGWGGGGGGTLTLRFGPWL